MEVMMMARMMTVPLVPRGLVWWQQLVLQLPPSLARLSLCSAE